MKPRIVVLERSRIDAVLDAIERIASGDLHATVPVSPARDELDAMAHGVNVMAGELELRFDELRQAQAAMMQASKFAALGEVSSGLAHELNNPLAIIQGYVELAKVALRQHGGGAPDEVWRYFDRIDTSVERMATTIRHVRDFSRANPAERAPLSLESPIRNAVGLMKEQLRLRNIRLELELGPDLRVLGDPLRLEQVFLNLFANARDAIGEARGEAGGTITVRGGSRGERVEVEVLDDGIGMPGEVKARMFDPFFTTKEAGKGSGLGLSISQGILGEHQGRIRVESAPGQGTCIRLDLPLHLSDEP